MVDVRSRASDTVQAVAVTEGFRSALVVAAGLALAGGVLAGALIRRQRELETADVPDAALPERAPA